jgi:4-hydroxyacetophenone monooxygenase
MMYGPNVNGGGGSVLGHLEAQLHYIMLTLQQMFDAEIAAVDCRPDVYEAYAERVAAEHERLVYTHEGVHTYYRNSRGRVVVQNAYSNEQFWRLTRQPDLTDYVLTPAAAVERIEAS